MRLLTVFFSSVFILLGLFLIQKTVSVNANSIREGQRISDQLSEYKVNAPDETLILDSKLREISGLSLSDQEPILLAVQDELGIIFHIDKKTGKITQEHKFGKKGDYEGVEFLAGVTYAVNSRGEIFQIAPEKEVKKIRTFLTESYDIEGLGLHMEKNRLLIACKEAGKAEKHLRYIFIYDPLKEELDKDAYITINGKELEDVITLKKPYFSPSAICAYKDRYYILSSKSKAILVLDKDGNFLEGARLSPSLHPQPEGITIDDDGTLFISNEGSNGVAKIYTFHRQIQRQ